MLDVIASILPAAVAVVGLVIWLGDTHTKMKIISESKVISRIAVLEAKLEAMDRKLETVTKEMLDMIRKPS